MIKNYSTYIKESYDYEEEDEEDVSWYEEDRLNNLSSKDIYIGMKVQCIEDCEIESQSWGDRHPIEAGDIKIVKGYGMKDMSQYIWFNDTPGGHGSYKKEHFIKI